MEQKEYKRCLDEIKCSEGFRNKMEKALSAEPAGAEEYEDSVSHVERIKTSSFRRYAALAAAFVLVCGAAGTVWYGISKSSRSSDHITAANEGVTSEDTTVIQAATEDRVVLPEGISNISWMSGDTPISMSFCTSDGQYAHTLEVSGVDAAPVAELIKSSQWTDDSDFIYSDFYVAGEAIINEQGQLLTGGQVYRTDSAHEVADAVYNAFSNSEDFTVNDELFYRISRSTENFTAMNASIEVIYDSPFSENGNIQCIGSNSGEMELTIDENGILHERTDIESAEYVSDGNDAVYKETIDGQTYTETMLSRFEPGLSYTQLINKVLYKLPVNKHEEEFVENGGRYVLDYGDEIHELVLDPDTGAITEYMEYSSDRTYISYKLRDIEYTGMEKSAADQHPETKDDNAAAQNIIRLNIPDAVNEIVYYPELSGNLAGGMPTGISASADTAELKALLSGCKWEKSTEGFDGTGCYVIINYSNGCDVKLNEQGQMNWKEQTFVTNDSTDDIISLLRGIFVYEPGSVEEYKADMVMFDFTNKKENIVDYTDKGPVTGSELLRKSNIHGSVWSFVFKCTILGSLRFTPGIAYGEDEEFTPQLLLRAEQVFVSTAKAYFYRRRLSSAVNNRTIRKKLQRLNDTMSVILHLQKLEDTLPLVDRMAIHRRTAQLTMDYIYNIIVLTHNKHYLEKKLTVLRQKGLFPLPDINCTTKYTWFRRMSNTSIGRTILMRTLPLLKRER